MSVAVIVQARLGSTRLPAKVLLPLPTGRTVLEEVLHRCKQIPGVDKVILATPATLDASILASFVPPDVLVFAPHKDEADLLGRYAYAANEVVADVVMRVTSDCPLIDPAICGQVLSLIIDRHTEYASNAWPSRHFPHGLDCEAFSAEALYRADEKAKDPDDREHVGPAIRRFVPPAKQATLKAMDDNSHIHWTLDTLEDYRVIYRVFQEQMKAEAA